jgi:hypothetical protein
MKHAGRVKVTPRHTCADTEVSPVTWRVSVCCTTPWLFTPSPPPPQKTRCPLCRRLGGLWGLSGWHRKSSIRIRSPENPVRSSSPNWVLLCPNYDERGNSLKLAVLYIIMSAHISNILYRAFNNVLQDYKFCDRKTVGHIFTKPVQIEGTTQIFFFRKLFFIVVHISAPRRCEGIRISMHPCWHVWQEPEYHIDVCCVTRCAHFEHF